eukprot:UN23614
MNKMNKAVSKEKKTNKNPKQKTKNQNKQFYTKKNKIIIKNLLTGIYFMFLQPLQHFRIIIIINQIRITIGGQKRW